MRITSVHENDPQFRQIEESVKNSPLMKMSVPDGVATPDTASPMDVARYQSQIDLHCKNIHGEEQRFAHGDVAAWRVSAVDMMPAPNIAEFDYGFTGWK